MGSGSRIEKGAGKNLATMRPAATLHSIDTNTSPGNGSININNPPLANSPTSACAFCEKAQKLQAHVGNPICVSRRVLYRSFPQRANNGSVLGNAIGILKDAQPLHFEECIRVLLESNWATGSYLLTELDNEGSAYEFL